MWSSGSKQQQPTCYRSLDSVTHSPFVCGMKEEAGVKEREKANPFLMMENNGMKGK
jgi:hypothetical protein